jgi:ABC-type glycerol-3-phosphate transport system permease component
MSVTIDAGTEQVYPVLRSEEVRRRERNKRLRRIGYIVVVYAIAIPGAVLFLTPFLWMFSTSLKASNEIFVMPPQWIPSPILWENYSEALALAPFGLYLQNTLFITLGNMLGNLVSCTLAAYAFARLRARGKNVLFLLMLGTIMLPNWVTLIPKYILFTSFGWNNSFAPLMIPPWFGWPFFIFLLRQFFMTIPKDLEESARLDGASNFDIFWRIFLPLSKPVLATVAVLAFIGNWNNFLEPLIYLRDTDLHTLAIAINRFRGQYAVYYNYMMAVSVLVLVPVIIIFFISQRFIVKGIVTTGLKG